MKKTNQLDLKKGVFEQLNEKEKGYLYRIYAVGIPMGYGASFTLGYGAAMIEKITEFVDKMNNKYYKLKKQKMKQSKAFHQALKDGDGFSAHQLFERDPRESVVITDARSRMKRLNEQHKAEMEYIKNLPEEFVKFEVQYQINKRK